MKKLIGTYFHNCRVDELRYQVIRYAEALKSTKRDVWSELRAWLDVDACRVDVQVNL